MALYEDTSVAPPSAVSAALGQLNPQPGSPFVGASMPASSHPFIGAGVPFPAYQPSPGQRVAAVLQQLLATPVPHRAAPHDLPLVNPVHRPAPHDLPLGGGVSAALAGLLSTLHNLPSGPVSVGGHLTYY